MSHNYPRTPAQRVAAREWNVDLIRRDIKALARRLSDTREGVARDAMLAELATLKLQLAEEVKFYEQTLTECGKLKP